MNFKHHPSYPYLIFFSQTKNSAIPSFAVKFPNPKRKSSRKRFCSSVSIHQPDLAAVKINTELPSECLLSQFPLIIYNLALAFRLPSQVLKKDVPYGKIIETPFSTQPLEMLQGFQFQFLGS